MEWTRGPIIGFGSTATVSLATVISSGELIAVKSTTELSGSNFLQKERFLLSKLSSCPYIVKYLDFNVTRENNKSTYNLCMEYLPRGTLRDEIRRRGGRLEEQRIGFYTNQIVKGLKYMHMNHGLVHCDLKSENVLIGKDGGVKIADLGCAKFAAGGVTEFSGTPVFMAPEVARREEQGFAADVWAVGCTVIEMATGKNPWLELGGDPVSALYRIGFSGEVPDIPGWLSEEARDFVSKCLKRDPEERLTAEELLQHPFLVDQQEEEEEFDFEKVEGFNANSPCTVLDHDIWDSLEVLENPIQNLNDQQVSCSNSPFLRIRELIGSFCPSNSSVPNWSFDEDWITVRSNCIEEPRLLENETVSVSVSELIFLEEEELQDSIIDEDFTYLELFVENVDSFSSTTSNVIVSFSSDDFVSENLNFETNNKNSTLIQFNLSANMFLHCNLSGSLLQTKK
ncbi:hypothetical protein LWI28_009002 [Acer negundo]|uniref:Protein kinase domain-containing protein n=1 Tax=Acer negundo TaxID=4023 RepID=A0AAD5J4L2_ACENE|nr:hypothetical protein LWI28_009002 [Acer negundo]KAK4849859.1 hypothetical protein QYF36_001430 [Acer negundo]